MTSLANRGIDWRYHYDKGAYCLIVHEVHMTWSHQDSHRDIEQLPETRTVQQDEFEITTAWAAYACTGLVQLV